MASVATEGLTIQASDVSGEKLVTVSGIPADATVGEVMYELLAEMDLPRHSAEGRPLTYHARLEREGRHLQWSEVAGEALQTNDLLVLQPNITAG